MKLTVYDQGKLASGDDLQGKRVVTVNRDGTIYLSKVLTLELGLKPGDRVCVANDKEKPKDWYLFRTDDEQGSRYGMTHGADGSPTATSPG